MQDPILARATARAIELYGHPLRADRRDGESVRIPSRGYVNGRPTRHVLARTEIVDVADLAGQGTTPGTALIYRCEETGAERRFGMQ